MTSVAYVEILYPGAFVGETSVTRATDEPIPAAAVGFRRGTRTEVTQNGETLTGPFRWGPWTYFGAVETVDEVRAHGKSILLSNMESNGWRRVVKTRRGPSYPLDDADSVVDVPFGQAFVPEPAEGHEVTQ